MMTLEIDVMSAQLPSLKKAAKELEIDLIIGEFKGDKATIHVIIYDYYQLILLGTIAGINTSYTSMKEPIDKFIDTIQRKVEKMQKTKDQNSENDASSD